MHFDARSAKLLPVGEHLIIEGCPGLRLVAAPKWKAWVYRFKAADGRMKQLQFGRWPQTSAAEAVARWQAMRDEKAAGTDPIKPARAQRLQAVQPAAEASVRQVVEGYAYGELARSRGATSLAAAQRLLDRFLDLEPELAAAAPSAVTRAQAYRAIASWAETAPTDAVKLRSLLGAAWTHAMDAGGMSEDVPNWWRQILHGKLKSRGKIIGGQHQGRTRKVLTLAECGQVLRYAAAHLPAHHHDVLVMYLWTAARGVEILRLQPEHLAEDAAGVLWATLPKALTKNAHVELAVDLRIPLFGRARDVVRRRVAAVAADPTQPMWPDAYGEPLTQKVFGQACYALMPDSPKGKARGGTGWPVTGWSAHRLRATARTLLTSLGCPHEVGEAIIGHVPDDVVGTYNCYTYDAERVVWLQRLSAALEAAATSAPG